MTTEAFNSFTPIPTKDILLTDVLALYDSAGGAMKNRLSPFSTDTLGNMTIPGTVTSPYLPAIFTRTAIVDAKNVTGYNMGTVPAGKTFVPMALIARATSANAITHGPIIGLGSSYGLSDVIAQTDLGTGFNSANALFIFPPAGILKTVSAGSPMWAMLGTAATGTSMALVLDLYGYLA